MRLGGDRSGWAVAALGVFVAAGVYGSTLGWGTDRDSVRVVASAQAILAGGYVRSRSFGFPLHEAACAALFGLGGLLAVNLGSVAVTATGIVVARRLVPAGRSALVTCVLCLCPLLLVNASSAIDFGWDFAGGMVLCVVALRLVRGDEAWAALGAVVLGMLLLRPDNLLFVTAVSLAMARVPGVRWTGIVGTVAAAGAAAAAVYFFLNGGLHGAAALGGVSTTRPWLGRMLRAGVFLASALGPGGALALAGLSRCRATGPEAAFLRRTVLFCWLLYLPRFIVLPDQLDYLILPVSITVIAGVALLRLRGAAAVGVLVCLPSLVTLSVLRRDAVSGALRPAPALQWGALPQDWAARRFAAVMQGAVMTRLVQSRVQAGTLHYDVFMPGYVSDANDLVIGRTHLYRVLPVGIGPGAAATVPRTRYGAIWACTAALGPSVGWRGWEQPLTAPGRDFTCLLASPR